MIKKIIEQRTVYFFAVEGESEQSFVKWLQYLADQLCLHVHLDCVVLGGGGYASMLQTAISYHKKKDRSQAKASILWVDADRAISYEDPWSLEHLKEKAAKHKLGVYSQQPNFEGILLRMLMPKKAGMRLSPKDVSKGLFEIWPHYKKPVDMRTLASKLTINDLQQLASIDAALKEILMLIGLCES